MTTRRGPDERLEHLLAVVDRVVAGDSGVGAFDAAVVALRTAVIEARAAAVDQDWETSSSVPESVGHNIASLRRRAGWTQHQLSIAMARMGFEWSRQTAAETERGVRRRASIEELFALSALFAIPLAWFLMPAEGTALDLNAQRQLAGATARELVVGGRNARLGMAGAGWRVAASVCDGIERPAGALARADKEA